VQRLLLLLVVAVLVLSGCSGGGAPNDDGGSLADVKVSGDLGNEPKVTGIENIDTERIVTRTIVEGDGAKVSNGQTVNLRYALYNGADGASLTSTYDSSETVPLELRKAKDKLLSGSLVGHNVGTRMLIAAPATEFYSEQGAAQAGIDTDATLVLVAEIASKFAAPKPTGTIDDVSVSGDPPAEPRVTVKNLVVDRTRSKVLDPGEGGKVHKGDKIKVRYIGVNGDTGKKFDSSYDRDKLATFVLDPTQMISGFVKGLTGQRIGSRVLLTIPYSDGYGAAGNPQANIKGGDTLVFVVDLVKKA